jgi:hypothetical protein
MQNVNVHERAAYFICMTHAALREGQMDNKLIIINMLAFIKATLLFCTVYEHSVKDLHDDEKKKWVGNENIVPARSAITHMKYVKTCSRGHFAYDTR